MDEHEVYPNAPVALVALEVRHPTADPLTPTESRALKKLFGDQLPIERPGQVLGIQITPGSTMPPATVAEHFPRYMNREMTLAVSIRKEALTVETSNYGGWQDFMALAVQVLDARMKIAPIAGVERVGLRYINEIRIPGDAEIDWAQWMHPSLLGPGTISAIDLPLRQWQGLAVYGSHPGNMLVLRYGPREGFAVDPASDLRRVKQADGSLFFLMDIDSFWATEGPVPEYDREILGSICEALHEPVRIVFENLITKQLRDEVFRSNA